MSIAAQLIPGYKLLSDEQRANFEKTKAGLAFLAIISEIEILSNNFQNSRSFFSMFYKNFETDKEEFISALNQKKSDFIKQIQDDQDYKNLITEIRIKILADEHFHNFEFLNYNELKDIANANYSNILQELYQLEENSKDVDDPNVKISLLSEAEELRKNWLQIFNLDPNFESFREQIPTRKVEFRITKFMQLAPLLKTQSEFLEKAPAQLLFELYVLENLKEKSDFVLMEEKFLTEFLLQYFQKTSKKYLDYLDLEKINRKLVNRIAKEIRLAADENRKISIKNQLNDYGNILKEYLNRQRFFINGKKAQLEKVENEDSKLFNSLSYLFKNSKTLSKTAEFLNKLADAHAFIQYTGFSTQNESSFLGILDLYNYGRTADNLLETKTVLYSLAQPFILLWEEYKEIALYEKDFNRKVWRMVIPLIVIAGFVALISFMLSPLALPEFALILIAIPAILIGVFLAGKYVSWKNELYQYCREKYYGGPFEIPEFQINPRMIKTFGDEARAKLIRTIYIEEIMNCKTIEDSYAKAAEEGTLTEEESDLRTKNNKQKHVFLMEWYDIHSNVESPTNKGLGIDKVSKIVEKRLKKIFNDQIKRLESAAELFDDLENINIIVQKLIEDLEIIYLNQNLKTPSPTENQRLLFFKPKTLNHQKKAEQINYALQQIYQPS